MTKKNNSNSFAVASLVCALLSWVVLGIILAPLSIVFGAVSLGRREQSKAMAVWGIAIGATALFVLFVSMIILASAYRVL